jgi:hypothetical protein
VSHEAGLGVYHRYMSHGPYNGWCHSSGIPVKARQCLQCLLVISATLAKHVPNHSERGGLDPRFCNECAGGVFWPCSEWKQAAEALEED